MPAIPYVRNPTWADGSGGGTSIDAADLNKIENGIYEVSYAPAVRVYHNANMTITTATVTVLNFNSERFDQAGNVADTMHDPVTNNTRLTCRYAGVYLIGACLRWSASPSNGLASFRLNGATLIGGSQASSAVLMNPQTVYALAVNDYVEVRVFQDSGSSKDITAAANESPEFWMVRVG